MSRTTKRNKLKRLKALKQRIWLSLFFILFAFFNILAITLISLNSLDSEQTLALLVSQPSDSAPGTGPNIVRIAENEIFLNQSDNLPLENELNRSEKALSASLYPEEKMNILLLGFDRSAEREKEYDLFRPDTIMIASVDFIEERVRMVSVPRDSYVEIAGLAIKDKINHSYAHGYLNAASGEDPHQAGIDTTITTIEKFLGGIPIHNYISIDMDSAANLIDYIGGVHYEVEFDVRGYDGRGAILVNKGYQLLDGEKFMNYVRNRANDQGGEQGRVIRQQSIVVALFAQLKQENLLKDLPEIFKQVQHTFETDLTLGHIYTLSKLGTNINPATIDPSIFHGSGELTSHEGKMVWYLFIDENKKIEIIKDVFGVEIEKNRQFTMPGQ